MSDDRNDTLLHGSVPSMMEPTGFDTVLSVCFAVNK